MCVKLITGGERDLKATRGYSLLTVFRSPVSSQSIFRLNAKDASVL